MDDSERVEYEKYQKSLHDQASAYESTFVIGHIRGHEVGLKKGIELEQKNSELKLREEKKKNELKLIKMVENLSKKGFDIDNISDITNLTIGDIKTILS